MDWGRILVAIPLPPLAVIDKGWGAIAIVAVWLASGGGCGAGHWQYRLGPLVGKSPQMAQINPDKIICENLCHLWT